MVGIIFIVWFVMQEDGGFGVFGVDVFLIDLMVIVGVEKVGFEGFNFWIEGVQCGYVLFFGG